VKRIAQVVVIVFCCTALSRAASVPGRDSPLQDDAADMGAMAVGLTDPTDDSWDNDVLTL
jgi:hypothetical protein